MFQSSSSYRLDATGIILKQFLLLLLPSWGCNGGRGVQKSSAPSMYIISLRVPTRKLREIPLFHVTPSFINCPSDRCANCYFSDFSDFDVFRRQNITHSLTWYHSRYHTIVDKLFKFKYFKKFAQVNGATGVGCPQRHNTYACYSVTSHCVLSY